MDWTLEMIFGTFAELGSSCNLEFHLFSLDRIVLFCLASWCTLARIVCTACGFRKCEITYIYIIAKKFKIVYHQNLCKQNYIILV